MTFLVCFARIYVAMWSLSLVVTLVFVGLVVTPLVADGVKELFKARRNP